MNEKIYVLKNIATIFVDEPPVFLLTAIARFASLFLLALVIFFCVLLLQISKNLIFKKGRHLFSQGLCCICLSLVLSGIFTPTPCTIKNENSIKRVELTQLEGNLKTSSRYAFIFEKEILTNALRECTQTISIMPLGPPPKGNVSYQLNIIYASGKEEEISINKNGVYAQIVPKSGSVKKYVNGSGQLYSLLAELKI